MPHTVYLVEQHIGGSPVCWRLLAERLPYNIGDLSVGLASGSGTDCMTPLNSLYTHDHHAAGSGPEYVRRVVEDVRKQLHKLSWVNPQDTGYTVHTLELP